MAPLASVLGVIFAHVLSSLIFKVFAAIGFGIVVWQGVGLLFDGALAEVQSLTAGLPLAVSQAVVLMRIDDAISVIFGAIAVRISLKTFGVGGNVGTTIIKGQAPSP